MRRQPIDVMPAEWLAVVWSFFYFFCLVACSHSPAAVETTGAPRGRRADSRRAN